MNVEVNSMHAIILHGYFISSLFHCKTSLVHYHSIDFSESLSDNISSLKRVKHTQYLQLSKILQVVEHILGQRCQSVMANLPVSIKKQKTKGNWLDL